MSSAQLVALEVRLHGCPSIDLAAYEANRFGHWRTFAPAGWDVGDVSDNDSVGSATDLQDVNSPRELGVLSQDEGKTHALPLSSSGPAVPCPPACSPLCGRPSRRQRTLPPTLPEPCL